VPHLGDVCKAIVESHEDVLIAAILDKEEAVDFYVRPDTPVPDDFRTQNLIVQTQLVVSTVKQTQDYLGEFLFNHIHMGHVDVLHIPLGPSRVLVAVIKPQKVDNDVVATVVEGAKKNGS
jgi:hypothetical protein